MGLQIDSEIFKWLQNLHIVKEGKRTASSAIEISDHATSKFFDGLYISHIVKHILKERGNDDAVTRLSAIKENSTPAIRLYNWNLLSDALKLLGQPLDYGEKSKLLNLQVESMLKVLRFLFSLRGQGQVDQKGLHVETSTVGQKTLKEAANIFQFLVISIGQHFKLSVPHTLNLFLDDNKYLAHLLVKGVKNDFQPIIFLLDDIQTHLAFIVQTLFCVGEKESVTFLLNSIKPCLISKSQQVAQSCLHLLRDLYETYLEVGVSAQQACEWMEKDGINTIFFSIKRHQDLFQEALAISYAYLEANLFPHIQPHEKSLLWNSQVEKVSFFRQLVTTGHTLLLEKLMESSVFEEWNKYCLKALRKTKSTQEILTLMSLYEFLWSNRPKFVEDSPTSIPNAFITFLKNCASMPSEIIFTEAIRVLFHLLVHLGSTKNSFAPLLYKTLLSVLGLQDQKERIEYMLLNFTLAYRSLPSLPASPLAEPLIRHLQATPSVALIDMAKIVLADSKLKDEEGQDIMESLAKIVFEDIQLGSWAVEAMISYLSREGSDELLDYYCKAALGQFVSTSKQLFRTLKQLKQDHQKYRQEESMRRGEASFLRNIQKYLILGNLVLFIQRMLGCSTHFRQDAQPLIFHTYLKLSKEMRKEHIARLLTPLLHSYYDEDDLPAKIKQFDSELQESIVASPLVQSEQASQVFQTPSPKKEKRSRLKDTIKTEQNQSFSKVEAVEAVRRQLEEIRRRREAEREKSMQLSRELSMLAEKKQLYRSIVNQKRIIQFGKKHQLDYDYKNLLQFDSFKPEASTTGLPNIRLLDLQHEEQPAYAEDVETFMKKYRKVWRFLFFKYATVRPKPQQGGEDKINMSQVWRMLKEYEFDVVKRQESQVIIRKVNEAMKRKFDPQNLTYLGFEEYLLQLSCFAYARLGYPHIPPARQLGLFLQQLRAVTASRGNSTDMFDNPEEVYFQETEVIRQFNRRLSENPDYVLPEGYKKIKQAELTYNYDLASSIKQIKSSYKEVLEVLNQVLWQRMQMHILQPRTEKIEKCLARPALFQKMKDKMKDYAGGYLMPKRSVDLRRLTKEPSPVKVQFHLMPNFSLGIKLGLAGVDIKLRYIADEVAYWMDDALDAVEAGKLTVTNKAKAKIDNEIIRRKRSEAYQLKLQSIEHQKKERLRAETVKNEAKKYVEDREATQQRKRQQQRKQKQDRKARQEKELKKKLLEFQQAKAKLQAKRRKVQEQKEAEIPIKKKEKEQYRKNVEEYFKKKKEQLQQKQKLLKANRQWQSKQESQKKSKQIERKKKLQIQVFRKEEQVLQKIVESRQSYEQIWRSPDIQQDLMEYRPRIKLIFDLLLRYQKSKISLTAQDEIGFNTLNFFALRTYIAPFLLPKNSLALLFKSSVRSPGETKSGLNYIQFQEFLFKIAVKAKDILNRRKKGINQGEIQESQILELPSLKSSPQLDRKKKSLTEQYALDAVGVDTSTLKRLMDFLVLPYDKREAEQRFRTILENTSSLPTNMVIKEAQNFLDSLP